jgi:hypothetical protein
LHDPAVVRATKDYVRVIIRRPNAYIFLNQTFEQEGGVVSATPAGCVTEDGTVLPLPGLYVLDSEGQPLATTPIRSVEELTGVLSGVEDVGDSSSKASVEVESSELERVSIRVSGFIAAEGIT